MCVCVFPIDEARTLHPNGCHQEDVTLFNEGDASKVIAAYKASQRVLTGTPASAGYRTAHRRSVIVVDPRRSHFGNREGRAEHPGWPFGRPRVLAPRQTSKGIPGSLL